MTFWELMCQLENRLGYHQVPLNPRARTLKTIFETVPLHPELMTRLARDIFKFNRCQKLGDSVNGHETFSALAPLRAELRHNTTTDIDTIRLLDELSLELNRAFGEENTSSPRPTKPTAEVIPYESFRRAKIRKLLA